MKITIHLKKDALLAANKFLQKIYEMPVSNDERENIYKSIGFDLADKFDKKTKTLIKNANLFDNKKIKLNLKYHEAWALEQILINFYNEMENPYQKTLTTGLIHTLNEKLA